MASKILISRCTGPGVLQISNISQMFSFFKTGCICKPIALRLSTCMKFLSSKNDTIDYEKNISASTIIMQDGLDIQELPLIVRKVNNVPTALPKNSSVSINAASHADWTAECKNFPKETGDNEKSENELSKDEMAIQDGLGHCTTLSEIFRLLEIIPVEEVTPGVAACAMKCICTLIHNSAEFMKQAKGPLMDDPMEGTTETFAWNAVLDRLCEIIRSSSDINIIIEALQAAHKAGLTTKGSVSPHNKLIMECLVRVADGKVDIGHICDLVLMLYSLSIGNAIYADYLDKLWVGISNNFSNINEHNIAKLFFVLPVFKKPQKILLNMLEKRTYACWWKLKVIDVVNILSALVKIGYSPNQLIVSLTKWLRLNIHSLSESDMLNATQYLISLKHFDSNIIIAMEKYAKARNTNIQNLELIATLADFCSKFRICSTTLLDILSICFVNCSAEFNPAQILRIVGMFGNLGYTPLNDDTLFACLEDVLILKFAQFKPEDVIELLLSCTFIQRYPLNFVTKIFNPFFLDRLKNIQNEIELRKTRTQLKLLDAAMSLECPQYRGPLLNKDRSNKSLSLDRRLTRMQRELFNVIADILGGANTLVINEYIPSVPFADIYCVDFVFHLNHKGNPIPHSEAHFAKKYAVIIHLPEHFTNGKRQLIGLQYARIRHLRILGYKVIQLEYEVIDKFKVQPASRMAYLKSKLKF